jgi:hypothetical protein
MADQTAGYMIHDVLSKCILEAFVTWQDGERKRAWSRPHTPYPGLRAKAQKCQEPNPPSFRCVFANFRKRTTARGSHPHLDDLALILTYFIEGAI